MLNRFNKSSRNYVKTICAAVSILVFLCIWQLVVSFTKAGLVLAGPVDTLTAFLYQLCIRSEHIQLRDISCGV